MLEAYRAFSDLTNRCLQLLPEFKVIAVFQDSSVVLCRQFPWPCQLSFFVNYLVLACLAMFEPVLHCSAVCDNRILNKLRVRQLVKQFDSFAIYIWLFGSAMTQIQNSLFIMRYYDVVIVFVESQWYNDTSPEYCFSLRARSNKTKVFTICLSSNDIKNRYAKRTCICEKTWFTFCISLKRTE
jgi:hypothetical protein